MSFNISEFKSSINKLGVQHLNTYQALIHPPRALNNPVLNELQYRVNSINWPGVSIATDEIRYKGYGLGESRPIAIGYEDITITVVADAEGKIHNFFHSWFELIFPTNDEEIGTQNIEFINYPKEIYGGLTLMVGDKRGRYHTNIKFIDPYVTQLAPLQMSWDSSNAIMLIPVTFKYRSYKVNSKNKGFIE